MRRRHGPRRVVGVAWGLEVAIAVAVAVAVAMAIAAGVRSAPSEWITTAEYSQPTGN